MYRRVKQNYLQSVSMTTKIVSSNTVHWEVKSIQHYLMKFVSDLQVNGFLWVLWFVQTCKTELS
jgi:hypothetical protein